MKKLNEKHDIVLDAFKLYLREHKRAPSIRGLRDVLQNDDLMMNSSKTVYKYLNDLVDSGVLRKNPHTRALELVNQARMMFVDIPIYGSANCGIASIVAEQYKQGTLKVSKNIVGRKNIDNLFAIQASGRSMNDYSVKGKKIEDGNFVLVDGSYKPSAQDKDVPVLAVIDGLATIKLLRYVEDDRIGLFPCSTEEEFSPIYLTEDDDLVINGRIIDVLKS